MATSAFRNATCGDCVYWDGGQCRRFPPQMVLWPTDNQHPISYLPVETFPSRAAREKACGEFIYYPRY